MKYISTILLFILTNSAFGQIDTSKIKITSKHYYEYTSQVSQCGTDNDSAVSDSVIIDIHEVTCPVVKTSDPTLDKFINDTILRIVDIDGLQEISPRSWNYTCIYDHPSKFHVDYNIDFINSSYLSLTIISDEQAGGGANGASHYQTALTFDLRKRKILLLKDVIKSRYDSMIYNIVIAEIKASSPNLFGEFGASNNPNLFHFTSTLDYPIAIKRDRVMIYWNVSWGSRLGSEVVNIYFDKYANLFDKKFIETVQKN